MIRLAQDSDAAAFFSHPEVRSSHRIFNAYVRILAGLPDEPDAWNRGALIQATGRAIRRMSELAVAAITEDLPGALELISDVTGLSLVGPATPVHTTDAVSLSDGFEVAPHVPMTEELRQAMHPLIEHDLTIYDAAQRRSERRLRERRRWLRRRA